MTPQDIQEIENGLSVQLPREYRALLQALPVVRERGTTTGPVWDVRSELMRRNLDLRIHHGWPQHLYCIGEDGGGSQFALDLRESAPTVWQTEHGQLHTLSPVGYHDLPAPLGLRAWYEVHIDDLQQDDIDITETAPRERPLSTLEIILGRTMIAVFFAAAVLILLAPLTQHRFTKAASVALVLSGAILMWIGRRKRPQKPAA